MRYRCALSYGERKQLGERPLQISKNQTRATYMTYTTASSIMKSGKIENPERRHLPSVDQIQQIPTDHKYCPVDQQMTNPRAE